MKDERTIKEIHWINILKFICIILIYLYHAEFYCGVGETTLQFFYLPFFTNSFFFVSGYLLLKKQLSAPLILCDRSTWYYAEGGGISLLKNILFKIAIPSVVFSTLIYFPKRILRGEGVDIYSMLHDTVLGGSLWFTCALVVAELLAFIVLFTRKKSVWWYVFAGILSVFLANAISNTGLKMWESDKIPWQYKSGLIAFFFLACGGLYKKYEAKIDIFLCGESRSRATSTIAIMIFTWVGLTEILIIKGDYNLLRLLNQQLTTGHINVLSAIWAVFSILTLINICKSLKGSELTSWVGRNSITFYFFCGALPNFFSIVYAKLIPLKSGNIMVMMVWVMSIACAFGIVYLFSRYIPWMFDFRKIRNK